ncbi:hypothetical protein PIB30_113009, partial [Stylosanthes scabra]|nr:hypothetical protein [Stylosanthes scabra]
MNYEAQYEEQQQNYYEPPHSPSPQQQQPPQPLSQAIFDLKILQEQQQQGFQVMTELVTNSQIEMLNYHEMVKTYQEYQYDQMKMIIAQQQQVIETQNQEFQSMKSQLEKELSEIKRAQVNLAMMKSSNSSQVDDGSKEELQRLRKIIEDQRVALVQQNRATLEDSQISSTLATTLKGKLDQIASSVKGFNEEL